MTDHPTASLSTSASLDPVLVRASGVAAALNGPVGRRELLLALVSLDPRGLLRVAKEQGLDARRLVLAMSELLPAVPNGLPAAPGQPPALAQLHLDVSATLSAAMQAECDPREALLRALLMPAAGAVADRAEGTAAKTVRVLNELALR